MNSELQRLIDSVNRRADWKNWGPYVSDRAWGAVREDYSPDGTAWEHFPFDHAHRRAYRWNEDGLAGVCNRFQNVCLALALWNGRDPILKERLFGLSNHEGNHGEDVKEYYYHLDNVPTHSYMKMLYKYPIVEYPYEKLRAENAKLGRDRPEYELVDAIGEELSAGLYFDVFIEYAKVGPEDLICRVTAHNRFSDSARIDIIPHFWYRNTWSWGYTSPRHPITASSRTVATTTHRRLGERYWHLDESWVVPELLFTENDTNFESLFGVPNQSRYVKDGFHDAIVSGRRDRVNPSGQGSKCCAHYRFDVAPGGFAQVRWRFSPTAIEEPFAEFDEIFAARIAEADEFYNDLPPAELDDELKNVRRQALSGLLWSKQFYHYSVDLWLDGDPAGPPPPEERKQGRNSGWRHLYNLDVLAMPDKWEYPWYAAWDLAFHCVSIALVDPEWAKRQLVLLLREWYMHPSGQLPAYEWSFGEVNPPVHAWAALKVYRIEHERTGKADLDFLEETFHKLLLNFTWWVNRLDLESNNIFQGGFLGLDNIGIFDRNAPLLEGGRLEQADGTAWMGMYCLNMFDIAVELAMAKPAYESVVTKFFEHFIAIAVAINCTAGHSGLWDDEDGFYFDAVRYTDQPAVRLKVRSFVGLIPLFAVASLHHERLKKLPRCMARIEWFVKYRPEKVKQVSSLTVPGEEGRRLLSIVDRDRLARVLEKMFDSDRFLSDYGLRSLSRSHLEAPFELELNGMRHRVGYEPGESSTGLFGGNSNWRGPVWFPVNFLMIESLRKYHMYYGDSFQIEVPTGSGRRMNLAEAADELSRRLIALFLPDPQNAGRRPFQGGVDLFALDPEWSSYLNFHEYFHGDSGKGLGACRQTGWTALVANLIHDMHAQGDRRRADEGRGLRDDPPPA